MSEEPKRTGRRVVVPRELLLVEVERYCRNPLCGARNGVGLTKEEARVYTEFKCERCERRWDDALTERDIPEWWEELKVTSLEGLRAATPAAAVEETEGPVARMSEAWRSGLSGSDEDTTDGGVSF